MLRLRKLLPLVVAAVAAIMGSANRAEAGFVAQIYDDGKLEATVTAGSPNSLSFAGIATTHFSVSGSGLSNFPGSQAGSLLNLSGNSFIQTNFSGGGTQTHTLQVVYSENGWTAPVGTPITLISTSSGGSAAFIGGNNTGLVQASYQSFLDNTNAQPLPANGAAFAAPGGAFTAALTGSATSIGGLALSPTTASNTNVPGGTPFTMSTVMGYTFTLDSGVLGSANISGSSVAAVPAPAGVVLALTGLPVLGIGGWLRRRRQAV